jgi:predicted Zn-dependent protease
MIPALFLLLLQISPEKQAALGERLARDYRHNTHALPGPAEAYLRRLAHQLAPDAHLQFELIGDDTGGPTHEPIVFPGYIFVPARLLLMTGSESELAGVLAHCIAHSFEPLQPVNFSSAADALVPLSRIPAERSRELAADRQAANVAAAAGYNPRALADYLRRVQPLTNPRSRLPDLADRLAAIDQAASAIAARDWKETTSAFSDAQEIVRRSVAASPKFKPTLIRPR